MKKAAITLLMLATFSYLSSAKIEDMPKIKDLNGKTFGDYQVVSYHSQDKFHNALWNCICSKCRCEKILKGSRISNGRETTCYCGRHYNHRHGDSSNSKEYRAWRHMLNRCYRKNVSEYPRYGGRGIKVCDRWRDSYSNFLSDMGRSPSPKHSLDRIENNDDYKPGNCRWATIKEQANNKRRTYMVIYEGDKIPLGILCEKLNLPIELIRGRLTVGWSIEKAIVTPKMR